MSVVQEVDPYDPYLLPLDGPDTAALGGHYESQKRLLDVCVGASALVLLAPVLAVAALAIKLTSRGPVLFRGTVIGRCGRPFTYYKLRTMVVDGDDSAHRRFIEQYVAAGAPAGIDGPTDVPVTDARREAPEGHESGDKPVHKLLDDPRITPVGRILRKTSLDEVAQIINVFRGEMSLVGPRPPVPYEYQFYTEYHQQRLAVLPGITGLAQVRARSRASFEEMVEIDLEYIRHRSIRNDLKIMAQTVWVVLSGRGAH